MLPRKHFLRMIVFHFVQGICSCASVLWKGEESILLRLQHRGKFSRAAGWHVLGWALKCCNCWPTSLGVFRRRWSRSQMPLFYSLLPTTLEEASHRQNRDTL